MSNMPARIWITAEDRSASWAGSFTRWHASDLDHGDEYPVYHRADIVERMAEAASETLAKFDACSDSTVRNTPLGLTKLRSALNSYREASNDKA